MEKIRVSTFCSGIGSPEEALKGLGVDYDSVFACEIDKYARAAYLANHSMGMMYEDMTKIDMGLPEMYSDTQLYKRAGNTISVPPIQLILKRLLNI
jgi:site-specific DNA-cytosine methylase